MQTFIVVAFLSFFSFTLGFFAAKPNPLQMRCTSPELETITCNILFPPNSTTLEVDLEEGGEVMSGSIIPLSPPEYYHFHQFTHLPPATYTIKAHLLNKLGRFYVFQEVEVK